MAPKRKKPEVPADDVDAEAAEGSESLKKRKASGAGDEAKSAPKVNKKHRNTKQETSPQALTRLEKSGKDFSKENEITPDPSGQSKESLRMSHHDNIRFTNYIR
jgi:hypothetical protein